MHGGSIKPLVELIPVAGFKNAMNLEALRKEAYLKEITRWQSKIKGEEF